MTGYVEGQVSLPFGQSKATPVENLLRGDALAAVRDVESRMLLSSEELEAELSQGISMFYHDPVLKRNRKQYVSYLKQLYGCGLIGLTSSCNIVCQPGLFFVRKKSNQLRMIVDARRANLRFRKPPSGSCSSMFFLQILG